MSPTLRLPPPTTRLKLLRRLPPPMSVSARPFITSTASKSASNTSSSSVDPSEVSHFNALASSWWDAHGPSRLLHLMNPLRHTFIRSCYAAQPDAPPPPVPRSRRILDVGCGGGIFAETAARLSTTKSVTAIDPSSEVLAVAKAHAKQDPILMEHGRLNYRNIAIEELELPVRPEDGYDIVTLFEVLEHVSHPSQFLSKLLPHVRPGGWLVVSTIARTWTSWFTTKLVAEDLLRIVPRGTHEWEKYINEDELRAWFANKQDWHLPRAMGVVYVPGLGWREVKGSEGLGNYFFAVRRRPLEVER